MIVVRRFSRPSETCRDLWRVYMDAVARTARAKKPFDKWAIKETDEALERFFNAVERELDELNGTQT